MALIFALGSNSPSVLTHLDSKVKGEVFLKTFSDQNITPSVANPSLSQLSPTHAFNNIHTL
jgi:hypothetical protein